MFRRLLGDDERFKSVEFRDGLNLLVADRTGGSTQTDSRNGVGKSSLVELLHFLLGASVSRSGVLANPELKEFEFRLDLDWPSTVAGLLETRRALDDPARIVLDPPPERTGAMAEGPTRYTLSEWQRLIERDLFKFPADHPGISGRAMLSLYMRRVGSNAFNDAVKTHPQQTLAEASANIAYLLGLDWQLASKYREISAREATRRKLTQASKDPIWGKIVGRSSELRGQISVVQQRISELEVQVQSFKVVPEYERLQRQADALGRSIRSMRSEDIVDRRNLEDLEHAMGDVFDPQVDYLESVYEELGVSLNGAIHQRFEAVDSFHRSVIRNRRTYLQEQAASLRVRLEQRERDRIRLGEQQASILQAINEGGALEALASLQQSLASERANLEALRNRFEAAQTLEASRTEIQAERSSLEQEVRADLLERDQIIDDVSVRFLSYARELYGSEREAYLVVDPTRTHLRIAPFIESQESRGIGNMVMFCFDLTVAVTALRNGRGPDFLVHDSHLFDGVDERQVAQALDLAMRVAEEEGLQYIATMNSDKLARAEALGVDVTDAIITPRLSDAYEDGGLFGFRF